MNETMSETTTEKQSIPVKVWPNEDGPGCFFIDAAGKRTTALPGDVLLVKVDVPHSAFRRHAWTENVDGHESRRGKYVEELAPEIEKRLRAFLQEVLAREPMLENGVRSTFSLEIGVVGWDDATNIPILSGTVSEKHEEEV